MIDIAVAAGCDAVKFQIFRTEQIPQIVRAEKKYLERCEFDLHQWKRLRDYCDGRIEFMLTPFDDASIDDIVSLGLKTIKVPSGRTWDFPFIRKIISTGKLMIVSTGMSNYEEIKNNKRHFPKNAKWLHCVTAYPPPIESLNLSILKWNMFDGYSDHTLSTHIPSIAVAIGAKIIEKHFTLRRSLPGPDQRCSLEPTELMDMVRNIRETEIVIGGGKKKIEEVEKKMLYRRVDND